MIFTADTDCMCMISGYDVDSKLMRRKWEGDDVAMATVCGAGGTIQL